MLYLTKTFLLNDDTSYSLYAAYAVFAYALPVLGGLLADRLLGIKQAIILGGLLLIVGNVLMALSQLHGFYFGLALTACGTGLYKPNSTTLIGKLYEQHPAKREHGFTLFYLGMNIGATASPFVYGFVKHWGFQYGYWISASLLSISWLTFLSKNKQILQQESTNTNLQQIGLAFLSIILIIALVTLLFFYPFLLNHFLLVFAAIASIVLIINAYKHETVERNRLLTLLALSFFGMCFFAASLQVGSSINLFIQRDINRLIGNWEIPTIMFASLYPLAVIVVAPWMAWLWTHLASYKKEPAIANKLGISLLLASVAFIGFMLAASSSQRNLSSHSPILWILFGNLALGLGEVCLMPAMFSAISQLAPKNTQSTMMGTWFLFIAFGGYLSGLAAKWSNHQSAVLDIVLSSAIYSHTFLKVSIAAFIISCLLFILSPKLKRFTQSNK